MKIKIKRPGKAHLKKVSTYALKNSMGTLTGRHCGTVLPSISTTLKATA